MLRWYLSRTLHFFSDWLLPYCATCMPTNRAKSVLFLSLPNHFSQLLLPVVVADSRPGNQTCVSYWPQMLQAPAGYLYIMLLTSLYSHRHAEGISNESTLITPSSSIASNFLILKICLQLVHFFPKGESNSPVRQWDSSVLSQVTDSTSWIFPSPFWTR